MIEHWFVQKEYITKILVIWIYSSSNNNIIFLVFRFNSLSIPKDWIYIPNFSCRLTTRVQYNAPKYFTLKFVYDSISWGLSFPLKFLFITYGWLGIIYIIFQFMKKFAFQFSTINCWFILQGSVKFYGKGPWSSVSLSRWIY